MSRMNWAGAASRDRISRHGSESIADDWEPPRRRPTKADRRSEAERLSATFKRKGGVVQTEAEAPFRTCTLPDPVPVSVDCEGCGRHADMAIPISRLSRTLRCSGCGMVALPF